MTDGFDDEPPEDEGQSLVVMPPRQRRWLPESAHEIAAVLRRLCVSPWLVGGRDDEWIAAVRRSQAAVQDVIARLGWVLVVERDLVRLRKSPPVRREAWAAGGPSPREASWFFIIVAAAESLPPRVGIAQLVTAARAAAAEAGITIINDLPERRAIARALRMLHARGVVEEIDGDVDGFVEDESAPVLLAVHHSRIAHVIANYATTDPSTDPVGWLEQVEREPDPARRMRRKLVDDTLVHAADLDAAEADWLRRRVRGDDGAPLAAAFGLALERRVEGAAFVVPDDAFRFLSELGPIAFPTAGTVAHAALIVCDGAERSGTPGAEAEGPGVGWRGLDEAAVIEMLAATAASFPEGRGGWRRELADDPVQLAREVKELLESMDLLRVKRAAESCVWWLSPATGRWSPPRPLESPAKVVNGPRSGEGAAAGKGHQPALDFDVPSQGPRK